MLTNKPTTFREACGFKMDVFLQRPNGQAGGGGGGVGSFSIQKYILRPRGACSVVFGPHLSGFDFLFSFGAGGTSGMLIMSKSICTGNIMPPIYSYVYMTKTLEYYVFCSV